MQDYPTPARRCIRCRQAKPLTDYWFASKAKGTLQQRCKPCQTDALRESRERHRDTYRERKRRERKARRERDYAAESAKRRRSRLRAMTRDPEGFRSKERAQKRRYYALHREYLIERAVAWKRDNSERAHQWARERRILLGDIARARDAAKRYAAPARYLGIVERYREGHREAIRSRHRDWSKRHRDRTQVSVRNRRARLALAPGRFTRVDWEAIKRAQDYRCLGCDRREPAIRLTIDHRIPISQGGTNWPDNLQGLCGSCNSRKGDRLHGQYLLPNRRNGK